MNFCGSCQTPATLLSKEYVNVRFEILSAVLMNVRIWYVSLIKVSGVLEEPIALSSGSSSPKNLTSSQYLPVDVE